MAAMAPSCKPWHDKASGKTFLRPELGKCLQCCFHLFGEEFGLCCLRVPTWAPQSRSAGAAGHIGSGNVAPAQAAARPRTDQKARSCAPLLPQPNRPRRHCRSLFASPFQHRPSDGCRTLNSSHHLSKLNWLETIEPT